jgi:hypothetical protein
VSAGAGYTYLNPKTGHEFSIVGGLTYSSPNSFLQYQNGIDAHLDWAASQFVTKDVLVGVAGYYFQQITDDSGPGGYARRLSTHGSASVRRSAFCFRSATIRVISTSRDLRTSKSKTGPRDGRPR